MLYMVECAFSDPALEAAWNDYYTHRKLDEVLAVPGFRTSQRFKSIHPITAPYLAIHSVDSAEVLTSEAYRALGGGSFDRQFQHCVTHWRRNLFSGLDRAPAIADAELVAITDEDLIAQDMDLRFCWLQIAGLDRSVPRRGFARVSREDADRLPADYRAALRLYAPIMPQRVQREDK